MTLGLRLGRNWQAYSEPFQRGIRPSKLDSRVLQDYDGRSYC
jgi:hypothetical protein